MTNEHPGTDSVYVAMTDLTSDVTEQELRAMLQAYGPVLSYVRHANVNNGRVGPDAYAEMAPKDAQQAVQALDGQERKGHFMTMRIAQRAAPEMEESDRATQGSKPRRTVLAPSVRPAHPSSPPTTDVSSPN